MPSDTSFELVYGFPEFIEIDGREPGVVFRTSTTTDAVDVCPSLEVTRTPTDFEPTVSHEIDFVTPPEVS